MFDYSKHCQSCGMPKSSKDYKVGTNSDGSPSKDYCDKCYRDGKFQDDFTQPSQMQELVKAKIKEKSFFMGLFSGFFTSMIPKLKRWNLENTTKQQ